MGENSPRQIPIDLTATPSFAAEDFVPTPSNDVAFAFLDSWPDWAQVGTVLLGPEGAGKSHLATMLAARAGAVITDMAQTAQVDRDSALIILDHQEGAPFDEEALFHLINHLRLSDNPHGRLLILSRQEPKAWGVGLPDLQSRLNAFDMVRISPPDDFSLTVLLNKLFADRQVSVDESVIAYLLKRMPRSYQAARMIVTAMDQQGLAEKRRLTRAIAAKVLDDLMDGDG